MRKMLTIGILLVTTLGWGNIVLAEEAASVTAQTTQSTPTEDSKQEAKENEKEPEEKKETETAKKEESAPPTIAEKPQPKHEQHHNLNSRKSLHPSRHHSEIATQSSPVNVENELSTEQKKQSFIEAIRTEKNTHQSNQTLETTPAKPSLVVEKKDNSFTSSIKSEVKTAQTTPTVTVHNYRERELRERELRLRELDRQIRDRAYRLSNQEKALHDIKWYQKRLRDRVWYDTKARDQELSYLLWREKQLRKYSWYYRGQLCHYVTYYRTGVKVDKRKTICEWRRGVYKCYHPKKYFIYPVTKLVCYPYKKRHGLSVTVY